MEKYYSQVIASIVEGHVKATKFVSPKLIIRATRKRLRGKLPRKGENIEMVVTIGRPNFFEREWIKQCQKNKEKFPLEGIMIKLYNPPKKKLKRKK